MPEGKFARGGLRSVALFCASLAVLFALLTFIGWMIATGDMHRAITDLSERLGRGVEAGAGAAPSDGPVKELAKGVDQLVRQMRAEQKVVREWVDEQAVRQSEVATVLKDLAANISRRSV